MSTFEGVLATLGCLGSLPWIFHLVQLAAHRDMLIFLAELDDAEPAAGWPGVAMIFAARDEAGSVALASRSMLAQDYPELEVIAVDDRSVDGTGAILDAIAAEDPRLRVVHVVDLPSGWLGKTHALQAATEATSARWLLFTDADVMFRPGVVRRAIANADRDGLDHVTVAPEVPAESVGERLFLSLFGLIFAMQAPPNRFEDRASKAHAGIGAFNLVRAETFRAIGGFRRIALSVDDDMRLAQALKFAGYKNRLLLGADAVSVRWQVGLGGMIRGLEKNFFAALGFRIERALGVAAALTVAGIAPYVGLFVGPWATRIVCGLGVATIATLLGLSSRHSRIGWYYAAGIPLATLAVLVALGRSVALTLARGGVIWRGHLYPLGELKAHVRARDTWAREVWRSTR